MFYLNKKDWSHRFEKRFFTLEMEAPSISLETLPYTEQTIGGRTKLPAYYYTIEVSPGTSVPEGDDIPESIKVFRRYSEFEWLYNKLKSTSTDSSKTFPTLPPKTSFCQTQTEEFRKDRQSELFAFLDDVLSMPGTVQHVAMKEFLMLGVIYGDEVVDDKSVKLEELKAMKEQFDKETDVMSVEGDGGLDEAVDAVVETAVEASGLKEKEEGEDEEEGGEEEKVEEDVEETSEEVTEEATEGATAEVEETPTETIDEVKEETPAPTETIDEVKEETPAPAETIEDVKEETPAPAETIEEVKEETPAPAETIEEVKDEPAAVITEVKEETPSEQIEEPKEETPEQKEEETPPEKIEETTSIPIETLNESAPIVEQPEDSTTTLEPVSEKGESLLVKSDTKEEVVEQVEEKISEKAEDDGDDI